MEATDLNKERPHTHRHTNTPDDNPRPIIRNRFGSIWSAITRRWAECALVLIIVMSSTLSLFWVFTVPILQCPDEDLHLDYAFSINSAGRLLNARTAPSAWNIEPRAIGNEWELISHIKTLYLGDATNFEQIRLMENVKVPPDYGTPDYYQRLDRNAPTKPDPDVIPVRANNPWSVSSYPFAYYGALAVWMSLYNAFNDSISGVFFWARIFSVFLLMCNLALVYAVARELRFRRGFSLLLTAIIAFFPLTAYVSSCIQPDNLTLCLTLLCFYMAFVIRRTPGSVLYLTILGASLGALLVTKYQSFLFVLIGISTMLATEYIFQRRPAKDWLRLLAFLSLPVLAFGLVQFWVAWGAPINNNLHFTTKGKIEALFVTFRDYYTNGYPLKTFWSLPYGWRDLPRIVRLLIIALTLLSLLLMFVRSEKVLTRLVQLLNRRRWRLALRTTFSNPLLTTYFIFTAFMFLLYALTDNSFTAQGRHWFPFILTSFLIAVRYAPQGFTHRRTQRAFSALILAALVLYCALGSYKALRSVKHRYYGATATELFTSGSADFAKNSSSFQTETVLSGIKTERGAIRKRQVPFRSQPRRHFH